MPNSPAVGTRPKAAHHPGTPGPPSGGAPDTNHIPIVRHSYISQPDGSHHAAVMDLHWLPEVRPSLAHAHCAYCPFIVCELHGESNATIAALSPIDGALLLLW